jgi:hypothetical protein
MRGRFHIQRFHGCSSCNGFAKEASAIRTPVKVTMPTLPTRVEQSYTTAGLRITRRDLRALCIVTNRTGVAKVVRFGFASQHARNDVIDFERIRAQLLL